MEHRCVTLLYFFSFNEQHKSIIQNQIVFFSLAHCILANQHIRIIMFNPTRSQLLFVAAIVIGLVIGKLIKNFKVAFAITVILMVAFSISFKKR